MNHIHRLMQERDEANETVRAVREALLDIELYLTSSKFHGTDNDYVHVSTDILPKIAGLRFLTIA